MCIWQGTMCSYWCNLSHQILSPMNRETLNNFQCVDFAISILDRLWRLKNKYFWLQTSDYESLPYTINAMCPTSFRHLWVVNNFQWVGFVITLLNTVRQKWSKHWNQALNSAQALKSVKNSAHLWVLEAFCERRVAFVVAAGFQHEAAGGGELINK